MLPVMMTAFGWPTGNCFAASVASILEIGIDDLPLGAIPAKRPDESVDAWLEPWNEWFEKTRGLRMVAIAAWWEYEGKEQLYLFPGWAVLNCKVLGAPPNSDGTELNHAVVSHNGQIVHDPMPNSETKRHLLKPSCYMYWVATDPSTILLRH